MSDMTDDSYIDAPQYRRRSSSGLIWLWLPLAIYFISSLSLAVLAYQQNDLTIQESIAAGFLGVGGVIVGLFGGLIGLIVGLFGAVLGIGIAGGTVAITLFVLASPVLALVLLYLLFRRSKQSPDPTAHGEYYPD